MAKQIVTAGLKCPPEVGAATMMANMIPSAKAIPIWKKLLNAAAPTGLSALTMKLATEATPENLLKKKVYVRRRPFSGFLCRRLVERHTRKRIPPSLRRHIREGSLGGTARRSTAAERHALMGGVC